jgi:hypothetical protein
LLLDDFKLQSEQLLPEQVSRVSKRERIVNPSKERSRQASSASASATGCRASPVAPGEDRESLAREIDRLAF